MKKQLPKGIMCLCNNFTPFGGWVFAHWNEYIKFACSHCGRKADVLQGEPIRFWKVKRKHTLRREGE
jgi:hypothetical protein